MAALVLFGHYTKAAHMWAIIGIPNRILTTEYVCGMNDRARDLVCEHAMHTWVMSTDLVQLQCKYNKAMNITKQMVHLFFEMLHQMLY